MSNTTVTIQQVLNWVAAFIVQRPTTGVGGTAGEPALTSANWIMSTILAPPFKWAWNRKEITFAVTQGTSDYTVALPDWGFIEKATVTYAVSPVAPLPTIIEIEVAGVLASAAKQAEPQKIAVLKDDNAGNIVFRIFPIPDQSYTANITYQKQPILATVTSALWAPIPDRLAFIYESGMLAHMQRMYNAQVAIAGLELFYRQLIGAAEGLSESERAIFLEDHLRTLKMQASQLQATQQGRQSRL